MGLSAPGQNATVEEILASIRQAISEDDARRTGERRPEPRAQERYGLGATSVPLPPRTVAEPDADDDDDGDEAVAAFDADADEDDATDEQAEYAEEVDDFDAALEAVEAEAGLEADADLDLADDDDEAPVEDTGARDETQDVIELAIEKAVNGVRAELEGRRAQQTRLRSTPVGEINGRIGQRPLSGLSRPAMPRREIPTPPPIRGSLMSPRVNEKVSGSFEDLAKAMIDGNSHQLNTVVENLLRPMLKQWLEGNLPQMVERLVREEIERVSRGRR